MFLIIGNTSGKTSTIRNILNLRPSSISTQDFKCYHHGNKIIVDTPSIKKYNNVYEIFEQCQKLSFQKIELVILFYTKDIKIIQINKIYSYLKSLNIDLYVYTNSYEWHYKNMCYKTINQEKLKQIITKNVFIDDNKIDKKYLLIGETNVGKSTFINSVINHDVIKTEDKKYTTKESLLIQTKVCDKNINLYDTYGLETQNKNKIIAMKNLIKEATRILIITDIYNFSSRFNRYITNIINQYEKNLSIIVTKLDLIDREKQQQILDYFYKLNLQPFFTSITLNNNKNLPIEAFKQIVNLEQIKISKKHLTENLKYKVKNLIYAKLINQSAKGYHLEILIKTNKKIEKPNTIKIKKYIVNKYNLYNFYININIKQHVQ